MLTSSVYDGKSSDEAEIASELVLPSLMNTFYPICAYIKTWFSLSLSYFINADIWKKGSPLKCIPTCHWKKKLKIFLIRGDAQDEKIHHALNPTTAKHSFRYITIYSETSSKTLIQSNR